MKIATYGAGGVGGYYGGRLAEAGHDVVFIARGAHLEAMLADGLRVDSSAGDFVIKPANATDDPAQVGVVDVVLVILAGAGVRRRHQADACGAVASIERLNHPVFLSRSIAN